MSRPEGGRSAIMCSGRRDLWTPTNPYMRETSAPRCEQSVLPGGDVPCCYLIRSRNGYYTEAEAVKMGYQRIRCEIGFERLTKLTSYFGQGMWLLLTARDTEGQNHFASTWKGGKELEDSINGFSSQIHQHSEPRDECLAGEIKRAGLQ